MRTGAAGVATLRHVGLVALESLLVAILVWIAAMTLAGATQDGGIVGSANAGHGQATLAVNESSLDGSVTFTALPGEEGTWVHATCSRDGSIGLSRWLRVDAAHHAVLTVPSSADWRAGAASCAAEEGYFAVNGRWRVIATLAFDIHG